MKKDVKKKIESHLRDDIETFHEEASEDKKLIKSLKGSKKNSKMKHGPLVKAVAAKMKKKKK